MKNEWLIVSVLIFVILGANFCITKSRQEKRKDLLIAGIFDLVLASATLRCILYSHAYRGEMWLWIISIGCVAITSIALLFIFNKMYERAKKKKEEKKLKEQWDIIIKSEIIPFPGKR